MGTEIILDQNDLAGLWKMPVRQVPEDRGVIGGGAAIGDVDMPPALKRREQHEEIGGAVALIFVIDARRLTAFHRHGRSCFSDQLFRGLVQTDQWLVWIARPRIDRQNVFHRRHERRVGRRWNDPLFSQVRFENVFFSVRPIVLSLARLTMPSSTTFSSRRRRDHFACPAGGLEQARVISRASFSPSKIRGTEGRSRCLRWSTASKPSSTNRCRVLWTVVRLVSKAATIRSSPQPSPASEI